MAFEENLQSIRQNYSCCDVADALLKLSVPSAGFLPDISPIPREGSINRRLVAPISTVLFVPKSHQGGSSRSNALLAESNVSKDKHWTDCPAPGSIVLMQQPEGQICALLGDLVASRLKSRGVCGAVMDGRVRDIASCGELCNEGEFQVWSKGISVVGTGLQAKPWAVDMSLVIGELVVSPGDIMVADEAERGIVVIPRSKLDEVLEMLPGLKKADDNVLKDVGKGVDLKEAFRRHRG